MKLLLYVHPRPDKTCDVVWTLDLEHSVWVRHAMQYFQEEVNPAIDALFKRYRATLPEESEFVRSGFFGRWMRCPQELAGEVESTVRHAYDSMEQWIKSQP